MTRILFFYQVTFVTQQLEAFDGMSSETVEHAIQDYPKLQVSLFPASVSDSPYTDVSVYQLLMGNAPFDPRKLFGWQTTNTCAGEGCSYCLIYLINLFPFITVCHCYPILKVKNQPVVDVPLIQLLMVSIHQRYAMFFIL